MFRNRLTARRTALGALGSLAALFALGVGWVGWLTWQDAHRPASTVVRDDRVRGSDGRQYRRVVRVERNAADHTVTTAVTFTDTESGGAGKAAYIQSEDTTLFASSPRLQAFVFAIRRQLGMTVPTPRPEEPLMSIPEPMRPGQKWTVRMVSLGNRGYSEGSGKAPSGAGLFLPPSQLKNYRGADIYYGRGVSW